MIQQENVTQLKKVETQYVNLLKVYKVLLVSLKRYKDECINKNSDYDTKEDRCYSVIKRFELTYELLWKYLREYIILVNDITVDSPRKVFQECLSLGLINKAETDELIDLIEDRNLTTHVYDEDLANRVANEIQKHHDVIDAIIKKVSLDNLK